MRVGFMIASLPIVSLCLVLRVKVQGCQRQDDADRVAQREPPCIVNEILLLRPDTHRVAIKAARIGALNNLAA